MIYCRILYTCITCLLITACDPQEPTTPVEKTPEIKAVPNAVPEKAKPALNLSIDSDFLEPQKDNSDMLINNAVPTEKDTNLFNTLNKEQAEPSINVSGEFLTDKNADEETDVLKSVDGIQIEIKGSFE